jgi:crossover junction endodeoxyribonuclease RuvC
MQGRRILGVDPGLNVTGYGILEIHRPVPRLVEAGVIRGKAKAALPDRVHDIYLGICDVITTFAPSTIVIEELYSHYKRPRTAILMGHARGVICLAAASSKVPVVGYAATKVKRILTGSGRAPKPQVQSAVRRELGLEQLPDPADVADALAIAMCHYYVVESKQKV